MVGDEFAALMRELKARSGLSYGVLAKRLHVSTSTLHRYVNGDAVPTDYAPVERLARVCRATPEELIELHRSWVLADALRRLIYERFDLSLGTGLSKLKGRMFRIGHIGDSNDLTILAGLAGCEMGMKLAGIKLVRSGVQAAMDAFTAHRSATVGKDTRDTGA